jgi:hypothetical protein
MAIATDTDELPSRSWRDYFTRAFARDAGDLGRAVRAMQAGAGLAGAGLAGVPPHLFVAFTAPATLTGNTTDAREGSGARVAFHEIGYWQIPAGLARRDARGVPQGLAPDPNVRGKANTWGRLAGDARVRALLGDRSATMRHRGWKRAPRDQHAVGLVMLRDHYDAAVRNLEPGLRPTAPGTPWGAWLMFMGFSAGDNGCAAAVARVASRLAPVREDDRVGALLHAYAWDLQQGWLPEGSPRAHGRNPVHTLVRTWQKFAFAGAIARRTGDVAAAVFFDVGLESDTLAHEVALVRGDAKLAPDPAAAIVPRPFRSVLGSSP